MSEWVGIASGVGGSRIVNLLVWRPIRRTEVTLGRWMVRFHEHHCRGVSSQIRDSAEENSQIRTLVIFQQVACEEGALVWLLGIIQTLPPPRVDILLLIVGSRSYTITHRFFAGPERRKPLGLWVRAPVVSTGPINSENDHSPKLSQHRLSE